MLSPPQIEFMQACRKDTFFPESNPDIRVYSIYDVAQILKCKERTVKHHLYETRDLKYLKIGREVRIREKDLIDFLSKSLMLCVHDQDILP
jgi:AraC-like DNA-binding protein